MGHFVPKYVDWKGKQGPAHNVWIHCQWERQRIQSFGAVTVVSALAVRDPISRFISGAAEVMENHCSDWLGWREMVRGSTPTVVIANDSSCGYRTRKGVLRWQAPDAFWPLLHEYLRDMAAGHTWPNAQHTFPQVLYAFHAAGLPSHVLHMEELGVEWQAFASSIGLSSQMQMFFAREHANHHAASPSRSRHGQPSTFNAAAWDTLCATYEADYTCFGYALPRECQERLSRWHALTNGEHRVPLVVTPLVGNAVKHGQWPELPPARSALIAPCATSRTSRRSMIRLVTKESAPAGLNDRLRLMGIIGSIAAALGARLNVDQPCRLLSAIHSNGTLDCTVPWARYVNLTFIDDGSPMIVSTEYLRPVQQRNGLVFISSNNGSLREQYCTARRVHAAAQPFLWALSVGTGSPFASAIPELRKVVASNGCPPGTPREPEGVPYLRYDVRNETSWRMPPNQQSRTCKYLQQRFPQFVLNLRDRLRDYLELRAHTYATLHIRRKDSQEACPTPLRRVLSYLNCSLPPLADDAGMALLIFTDETDPVYIQALLDQIRRLRGPSGVMPVHAEPLLTRLVRDMLGASAATDNYLMFNIGLAVQQDSMLPMQLRGKNMCPRCFDGRPASSSFTED